MGIYDLFKKITPKHAQNSQNSTSTSATSGSSSAGSKGRSVPPPNSENSQGRRAVPIDEKQTVYDKLRTVVRNTTNVAANVVTTVTTAATGTSAASTGGGGGSGSGAATVPTQPKQPLRRCNTDAPRKKGSPGLGRPRSALTTNANGQPQKVDQYDSIPTLIPFGPITNMYEKTYDCCAFMIHCRQHNKVAVSKSSSKAIWLPFTTMPAKMPWTDAAKEGLAIVLATDSGSKFETIRRNPPYDYIQILEIFRLQMPQTRKFVTRITFYIRLKAETLAAKSEVSASRKSKRKLRRFNCCTNTGRLIWYDLDYICNGVVENIWGPELVEFCRLISMPQESPATATFPQKMSEFGLDQIFQYLPRDSPQNLEESLLKLVKITEKDIERLFNDFLDHCYPCFYMTVDSFKDYMLKNGFETIEIRLRRLFNAFNYNNNGFLTFHELLLGFVSMERDTPHDEVRIKFIFRYYDAKKKGALYEEDFKKIIRDLTVDKDGKQGAISEAEITRKAKDAFAAFSSKPVRGRPGVSYKAFLVGIASHCFRGTSVLCRSKKNIFSHISRRMTSRTIKKTPLKGQISDVITKKFFSGTCTNCKAKNYKLSNYVCAISCDGYIPDSAQLLQDSSEGVMESVSEDSEINTLLSHHLFDDSRIINAQHPANILIQKVREFNSVKYTLKENVGLMANPGEREHLYQLISALCDELEPILRCEPRCKPVESPVFIIGDIHGNLEDLMSLEKTIWRRFPFNNVSYLFLGDYVDRGRWSVECALYLFSMKVLMPSSVTMLRGNHEVRDIQNKYTYRRECFLKYDENYGQKIWDITNRIFDRLPMCAVVDDSIFCAHGGIPHAVTKIQELNETIPAEVYNPEHDCLVSWEIMWSDPITAEQFRDILETQNVRELRENGVKDGYVVNTKRGTAYYFNEVAIDNFLDENSLTHVIRAHEVPKWGFMFHFEYKCTTIFSCSHYCGNDNDCACIMADDQTLRIIRIDTANNAAATDPF